jgi:hypothetical protein
MTSILGRAISVRFAITALIIFDWQTHARAADLKPETAQAWEDYLHEANIRIKQRLSPDSSFLWIDEAPERVARVKSRQIVVSPAVPRIPRKVPSGLIHDWIGAAFMPGITIRSVLPVLRDYGRYKEFYQPHVVDSKAINVDDAGDRFSTVLLNKEFFKKTALNSENYASYVRIDDQRMYSISQTTHIREIAQYGSPGEHTLPEDKGTGLIWRLYSVVRFYEREGGLYIEVEAIALSRDIPSAMRLVAEPIVRRVSRDSLITALQQTEAAVRSAAEQNRE